jgi:hypothetical protein
MAVLAERLVSRDRWWRKSRRMDVKKVTLLFAVALGLAVATFVGLWSSNSASAGDFNDGLKCYRPTHIVTEQVYRGPLIYISDQFQERNVIVKKPVAFCTLADKGRAPDAGDAGYPRPTDLVCYETKDAPGQARFQTQRLITEDQFDYNFLVLTKPYALCESASKQVNPSGAAAGFLNNGTYEFRCYKARREENGYPFEKISVSLFDQFDGGGKDVRLGRPTVFCTQLLEKKNKAKSNHIDHAIFIDPPVEYHASTISATNDRSDPRIFCEDQTAYGHSVWFTYTPGADVKIHLNTEYSTYDTIVAIFRGDPANGDQIACDDDGGGDLTSQIETKLEYGSKYYILVGAYGGSAGGKLKLNIETDDACDQSNLCGAGSTAATNVVDLGDVGETAGEPPLNLVCYSVSQPAPDGVEVRTEDQLTLTRFDVGRGIMYCTPADKCVLSDPRSMATDLKKKCGY